MKSAKKDNYILVLGYIPNKQNEKDGMVQREIAIDGIFEGIKRVYIEGIGKKRGPFIGQIKRFLEYIKDKKNELKTFQNKDVKLCKSIDKDSFYKLCKNAKVIYAHSVYYASLLSFEQITEFKDKIIVDIHGCIVEEQEFMGRNDEYLKKLKQTESLLFNSAKAFVAVSNNMIDFYRAKYPNATAVFILLPIFTTKKPPEKLPEKPKNPKTKIIYSGGIQKWQNADLMADSISKIADKFDITILTPNINEFRQILNNKGVTADIEIKTVDSNKLYEEYKNADFGYILRDDILVNKVSCPTKMIEYMTHGIIPIVLQPNIGDFNTLGYSYILNDDLIKGNIPTLEALSAMRENNRSVLLNLHKLQEEGKNLLRALADKL